MKDAKSVVTTLAPHFRLSGKKSPIIAEDKAYMDNVPYASAAGSLCTLWYVHIQTFHKQSVLLVGLW